MATRSWLPYLLYKCCHCRFDTICHKKRTNHMGCIHSTTRSTRPASSWSREEADFLSHPHQAENTSHHQPGLEVNPTYSPATLLKMSKKLQNQIGTAQDILQEGYDDFYQTMRDLIAAIKTAMKEPQPDVLDHLSTELTALQKRYNAAHYAAMVDSARAAHIFHGEPSSHSHTPTRCQSSN